LKTQITSENHGCSDRNPDEFAQNAAHDLKKSSHEPLVLLTGLGVFTEAADLSETALYCSLTLRCAGWISQ
jgi:hypothetical protein